MHVQTDIFTLIFLLPALPVHLVSWSQLHCLDSARSPACLPDFGYAVDPIPICYLHRGYDPPLHLTTLCSLGGVGYSTSRMVLLAPLSSRCAQRLVQARRWALDMDRHSCFDLFVARTARYFRFAHPALSGRSTCLTLLTTATQMDLTS